MILVDTGPIVALINKADGLHRKAHSAALTLFEPRVTTQACITESLFLLGASVGWNGQRALHEMVEQQDLFIAQPTVDDHLRAFAFMKRFRDIPCDYADATLLVAAEETGARGIFTFDKHFYAYRLSNGDHLNVIP